jgi:hypothetical protein
MKRLLYVLVALTAVALWRGWQAREIRHEPGVLVSEPPRQTAAAEPGPFEFHGFQLTRRAAFELRARVLSREDYHFGMESKLSPMDLALGWGAMSDQAVLERIEISQGSRWYFTRYQLPAPLSDGAMIRSSSNMHLVPADELVGDRMKQVRRGDVVRALGYLVDVAHPSGFRWRTSLRRDDTGNGSCELFYVERFQIEPRP